ncbi:MAG TPA: kelch repeat-containing protein [Candidatus Limnocylindrales bacterium]|nr:kelch repeat-containing protein [Candidatus Limnocylindrales bacterium]
MDDLRRRFASLDHVRTPDLWDEIEQRAVALGSTRRLTPVPVPVMRSRGVPGRTALALLVAAGMLVGLTAGAIIVGSGSITSPSPSPSASVTSSSAREPSPSPARTPSVTIGRFVAAGSLVEGRAWHSALVLPDGRVLIVGGEGSHATHGGNGLDSIEVWDPIGGDFVASGEMERATYGDQHIGPHLFRMTDGRSLLVPTGCVCGPAPASTPAQVWDRISGAKPLKTLAVSRVAYTATQLADGRVLIAGGVPGLIGGALVSAEIWDPVAGTVEPTGALSVARADAAATLLTDGRILIVGGATRSDSGTFVKPVGEAEIWDPASGTFSTAFTHAFGPGGSPGGDLSLYAITLQDGRVLVLDGAGAHVWDPTSGTLSAVGAYREARREFSATLLADGRVLVAGGSHERTGDGRSSIGSTEIWDPSSLGFEPGPDLRQARAGHTATLLTDGRVLIVGGASAAGLALDALASAEVWEPAPRGDQ